MSPKHRCTQLTRLTQLTQIALAACGLTVLLATGAAAAAQGRDAWQALKQPGTVAIMRHANAPGTGDPADFQLGDCSTQRTLDDRGRAQARAVGDAFRAHGIRVDRVLTSQWCRCRNTAELLDLGPVEDFPALNSFFGDRSTRAAQTRETRARLAERPADEKLVVVTHQVNISALTGEFTSEGEILVLDVAHDGAVEVLGAIRIRP